MKMEREREITNDQNQKKSVNLDTDTLSKRHLLMKFNILLKTKIKKISGKICMVQVL
jgi:hypothetical protein